MSERIVAIGDIHGCFDALKKLIEDKIKPEKTDKIVFLGDYIDRGPKVKSVINYIMKLQVEGYQIVALRGNHEDMLLNAYEENHQHQIWMYNGGDKTLKSFGISSARQLSEEYLQFFQNLDYYFLTNDFLFVHAGLNDNSLDPFTDKHRMLWECRKTYNHPDLRDKTVIHGHCAITAKECDKIIRSGSQVIDIDTGCVYTEYPGFGNLTAIELHSKEVFRVKCDKGNP